jgi:hypothetical protein
MRENSVRPRTHRTGRVSRTESGYVWKWPAAQYGVQSFALANPVPVADAEPHPRQLTFVRP